ncbi:hematopoietic cell-specific Lyn substrate 1-like [Scleropages formosus]|uniref:Hematopoietic cell-specific Lyn substrate 1-like n=1 Tax=Scleropages formosus TaxID=113540 RepID=A0A0P7TSV7_SCLFO|nr:hematopoietic cell-specific Lyn substrate 1-like [Scleropages formosus]
MRIRHKMWKSVVGHNVTVKVASEGDDWETDPDFEVSCLSLVGVGGQKGTAGMSLCSHASRAAGVFQNDVSEQEQRWGAKTIEGSGRKEHISVAELRQKVSIEHEKVKKKELEQAPKASYGYGGKFGVEKDRMDKMAVGHGYVAQVEQHSSQTDAARGFGGKFGVQKDRVDKSAVGFEYKGNVEQHASQKDYSKGFGGKYGVEKEKVDKAAVGYDYKGETEKHHSQKDYAKGFGGKFGVEKERVDKSALGYDYKGETEKHESQKDYAKGFGGRYGVETDRVDKSAASFTDMESPSSSYQKTQPVEASGAGAGNLKARFENMARASDEENRKRAAEERARRQAKEKQEKEEAQRRQKVGKQMFSLIHDALVVSVRAAAEVILPQRRRGALQMVAHEEQESREQEEEEAPPPPVPQARKSSAVPRPPPKEPEEEEEPPAEEPLEPFLHEAKEEQEYDEPPALPPRADDLLDEVYSAPEETQLLEQEGDYEDILVPPQQVVDNDYEDLNCGQTAVALYDYQGEGDDEISFDPDDIITNIEMVDEAWWRGHCNGRFGLFPSTFVRLM